MRNPVGAGTVDEAMTRIVYTVSPDSILKETLRILAKHDIGAVVVTEEDRVLGILTERDIVKALARRPDTMGTPVGRVMSRPVATVSPKTKLAQALKIMVQRKVRRLPVTTRGKLHGIITARDIMHWMLTRVSPKYRAQPLALEELARIYEWK
jgi:CBS domain-containing protein